MLDTEKPGAGLSCAILACTQAISERHSKTSKIRSSFRMLISPVAIATATSQKGWLAPRLVDSLPQVCVEIRLRGLDPLLGKMMLQGAKHHAAEALLAKTPKD